MIAVKPETAAGCILAAIVRGGGLYRLDELADRNEPPPHLDRGEYVYVRDWRRRYALWVNDMTARRARASRTVGRLREAGLVAPASGPPRVAADVPDPLTADWLARRYRALADYDRLTDLGDIEDWTPSGGETAPSHGRALEIVRRIRAGAATVEEAVGTDGHAQEVWAALVGAEVVLSPRRIEATAAGVGMVEGWR